MRQALTSRGSLAEQVPWLWLAHRTESLHMQRSRPWSILQRRRYETDSAGLSLRTNRYSTGRPGFVRLSLARQEGLEPATSCLEDSLLL